jgi:ArsR family transcriptional regulator
MVINMRNGTPPEERPAPDDRPVAEGCCGGAVDWISTDDAERMAHQLAAVADPVRLQVLSIIANAPTGEVCACDFVGPIEKSQPTISHHLKVLTGAGLVEGHKRGRWVWYQLSPDALTRLLGSVSTATTSANRPSISGASTTIRSAARVEPTTSDSD